MRTGIWLVVASICMAPAHALAQSVVEQVEEALLPLPGHLRAEATVVTMTADGEQRVLRQGTNSFVCWRDTALPYFRVNCFDEAALPTMNELGRLMVEGLSEPDAFRRLNLLMRSGEAPVPPAGAVVYVVAGPDETSYEHISAVFLPNATPDATGLSLEYRDDGGWLMCEGTPFAHIMIGPEPYGTPDGVVEACAE